jgi:alanyl aminopeptidase
MKALTRLFFLTGLLFGASACNDTDIPADPPVPAQSADPYRLASTIRPLSQALKLRIDPAEEGYSGSTTISIAVQESADVIRLHAEDLDIRALRLSAGGVELPVSYEIGELALLSIAGDGPFAPGTYELEIEFANDFNTDGVGIFRGEMEGNHYIFSQFEDVDAREAFPCFDEPGFKFPWQLTISAPDDAVVITNTPEENIDTDAGWTTTRFATTPALPTYLIAIAVGPFDTVPVEGLGVPGRIVVPKGKSALAAFAAETAAPLMGYLEDYFGEPYPFRKLDMVAVFGGFSGAMEHPGLITYSDFILLLEDSASPAQKDSLVRIHAHEFAHQWFGNLVTMQWWDDLWLNESFADWMADKTAQAVYPDYAGADEELSTIFRIMDVDTLPTTEAIRGEVMAADNFRENLFLSYYKGKAVLGMFEVAVGEDRFRDGIVRYIRKFSGGNAEAGDLWNVLAESADFDLAAALRGFVDRPGVPMVSVAASGNGEYAFSQQRFIRGDAPEAEQPNWIIPVSYRYRDATGIHTGELILDEAVETVDLGGDVDWIYPNANQRGYYRWNLPADMLVRLGTEAGSALNVRERMGMLSNLWALVTADTIEIGSFLDTIEGMASDPDTSVVNAVLDQLNSVRRTFVTADLRDEFAAYVRQVLGPVLDRVGVEMRADDSPEIAELRPQLLLWLSDYGNDERAQAATADMVKAYLAGETPFSPAISIALRAEARRGDQALFDAMVERFESAETVPERFAFLAAIGSFREAAVVAQVLEFLERDDLRRVDLQVIAFRISAWPDNLPMLFDWLVENDAELRERLPDDELAGLPGLLTSCSTDNLQQIRDFYGAPERAVPGIEDSLEDEATQARDCWALRQRELPSITQYLGAVAD